MLKDEDSPETRQREAINATMGSLVCMVFIALCVVTSHVIFYDKLDTLQARQDQKWKVIHLTNQTGLEYQVEKHRNSGHQFRIQLDDRTLFNDNCMRILDFCKALLQNNVQVTAFDFYAIDHSNNHLQYILEPQLKTIYYLNEQQQATQIEYAKRIPNHEKNIQIDKNSFIGFFILRLFLYGGLIAYLYALTPNRVMQSKYVYYPFYCVSIPMILHYLHFMVIYIIRV